MMLKPLPDPAAQALFIFGRVPGNQGEGYDYGFEAGQGVKQRMKTARATTAQIQRARPRRSQGS